MAVEIPVVIDIDKAFDEAAKRVDTASKPFVRAVDSVTGQLKLKIGVEDDGYGNLKAVYRTVEELLTGLKAIKSNSGQTFYKMAYGTSEWATALEDAKTRLSELTALQARGISVNTSTLSSLRESIILITDAIAEREKEARLIEREAQYQLSVKRAIDDGNYALIQEAKTVSEITNKISALRGKLNNIDPKSSEWSSTVREIKKATDALAKLQAKINGPIGRNSIDDLSAKMRALEAQWNAMSKGRKFDKDGQLKASAQKIVEKYRMLAAESEEFGKGLASYAKGAKKEVDNLSGGLDNANSKLGDFIKNGVRLLALRYMSRFVQNVRNVTAEFEMQRISLASIIRDTSKANTLFAQIKESALESPFEIKDLLKYTKQLAAYRIETDKLFDTTKRLADISAGLGVDMQRLILAYGQVRAAAVLRGQELRQFTEAGIPLVELLADKFTELKGRMVSTSEVFELISKRAVPFSMIAEIFEDMTNAGGVFYEMQLKQSETLKGQWMKLKDAASIMYDEIGNTSAVNEGMKKTLQVLLSLTRNWRGLASTVAGAATAYGALKTARFFTLNLAKTTDMLSKSKMLFGRASRAEATWMATGAESYKKISKRLMELSVLYEKAAMSGNRLQQMSAQMQIGFTKLSGTIKGTLIAAIIGLIAKLVTASSEAKRLQESIEATRAQGVTDWDVAQRNFKRLADEAVNAADGSQKQRDALRELKQTYKDVIPEQDLEIERLRALAGNYDSLTEAIRQNIEQQIHEQNVRNISTTYGQTIGEETRAIEEGLRKHFKFSVDEARKYVKAVKKALEDGILEAFELPEGIKGTGLSKTAKEWVDSFSKLSRIEGLPELTSGQLKDLFGWSSLFRRTHFDKFIEAVKNQFHDLNEELDYFNKNAPELGQFGKYFEDMQTKIREGLVITAKKGTYGYTKELTAQTLDAIRNALVAGLRSAGVYYSDVFNFEGVETAIQNMLGDSKVATLLRRFVSTIRKEYEKIVPPDPLVGIIRRKFEEIAAATGASMDDMQRFFKTGEQEMYTYVKELGESLDAEKKTLTKYQFENEELPGTHSEEEIKRQTSLIHALTDAYEWLGRFQKNADKKADKSALAFLREDLKNVQEIYKRYQEFLKYMSKGDAQKKIQEIYGNVTSIDFLNPEDYQKRLAKILAQIKTLMGRTKKYAHELTTEMFNDIKEAIKRNEGYSETAYKLAGESAYTIGYGFYNRLPDGREVTEGMKITTEEAEKYLDQYIRKFSSVVDSLLSKYGQGIELTEKQYNILLNLAFQGPNALKGALKRAKGDINQLAEELKSAASSLVAPEQKQGVKMRDMRRYQAFMAAMPGAEAEAVVQAITEAERIVQDVEFDELKKKIDDEIKRLSDDIKHSKTVQEFFNNILSSTGDQELATSMTVSVYGNVGEDLRNKVQEQLMTAFVVDLDILPSEKSIEDLQDAIDKLDWRRLASYLPYVKTAYKKTAEDIVSEAQKASAEQIKTWVKELSKAKSFAQQRADIAIKTQERIREIEESNLSDEQKKSLKSDYRKKQADDIAKLEYEAFRDMPIYIQMFSDLESVSTGALKSLREQIEGLRSTWQNNLNPTELKELETRLQSINEVLAQRNPFGVLAKGFKDLIGAGFGKSADLDRAAAEAAIAQEQARRAQAAALEDYNEKVAAYNSAVSKYGAESAQARQARNDIQTARTTLNIRNEALAIADEEAKKAQQEQKSYANTLSSINSGLQSLKKWGDAINDATDGTVKIMESFGAAAEDIQMILTMQQGLNSVIDGVANVGAGVAQIYSGHILSGASSLISGIGSIFSGVGDLFSAGKVRKAEKEIKRQQNLIESLQYSYERLENQINKAFGSDYIENYNNQLRNLEAQRAAYQAQARAEESKGKKKDKDKIKEYTDAARDASDKIADMKSQLAEFFTGTDVTSAAKDFASAWIEAYKEFGSTTNAMSEKFREMIEQMIQNSLAAKIMQSMLQPIFDSIDVMAKDGALTASEIASISAQALEIIPQIDDAMTTLMNQLAAAGYNIRQTAGQFTGISRDIASASEESILGLTAGINTQNFYISRIDQNLAAILALMGGSAQGASAAPAGADKTAMSYYQTQVLGYVANLPQMRDDMAAIRTMLDKVIKPAGVTSGYRVIIG